MNLLFEEIREKHSFCYSISSSLIRFDGALLIVTGAQKDHFDEIRELIAAQIDKLKHATKMISEERLTSAHLDIVDAIRTQDDSALRLMAQMFMNIYLKREISSEQMIDKILNVSLEDVEKAARPLHLIGDASVIQSAEGASEELLNSDLEEIMQTSNE